MKNLFKIVEFISAIVLAIILFPLGILYSFLTVLIFKLKFLKTILYFLKEVYLIILDIFEKIAVIIDRLGNIIVGDLFIEIFVQKKYRYLTLFKKNEITISAAFGHAYEWIYLKKSGIFFVKLLSKVFGKDHATQAYKFYELKKEFNSKTGIS